MANDPAGAETNDEGRINATLRRNFTSRPFICNLFAVPSWFAAVERWYDTMEQKKKRVLILSTSAGTGHVRAAQALEKEFAADPGVAEVVHEDALKYTNKLFRDFYSTLYTKMVRDAPDAARLGLPDERRAMEGRRGARTARPAKYPPAD